MDAETGEFRRLWGAFGNAPLDPPPAGQPPADGEDGPPQFGIVHGIEVSNDGLVYVADRNNSRIQIFEADGTFVRQAFVNRGAESALTVAGLAFSPDAEQRFVYVADQGNSHIHVLDRGTLETLDSFGRNGASPGEFQALHHIASDSQGNLYTAEAQRGRRVPEVHVHRFRAGGRGARRRGRRGRRGRRRGRPLDGTAHGLGAARPAGPLDVGDAHPARATGAAGRAVDADRRGGGGHRGRGRPRAGRHPTASRHRAASAATTRCGWTPGRASSATGGPR